MQMSHDAVLPSSSSTPSSSDITESPRREDGERLQASDLALSLLQANATKQMLYAGASKSAEQFLYALQDDLIILPDSPGNSQQYVQLYSKQFNYLQRLITASKNSEDVLTQRLLEAEDRHEREKFTLETRLAEAEKAISSTQDSYNSMLEDTISSLKTECKRKQSELERLDTEMRARELEMQQERERQRTIVFYLLHERKQLFASLHQLQLRIKDDNSQTTPNTGLISELRTQLRRSIEERNKLALQNKNLMHATHQLEDELNGIKLSMMTVRSEQSINKSGSLIVANRSALDGDYSPNDTASRTIRYNRRLVSANPSSLLTAESSNVSADSCYDNVPFYALAESPIVSRYDARMQRAAGARPPTTTIMGVSSSQLRTATRGGETTLPTRRGAPPQPPGYSTTIGDSRLTRRSTSLPRRSSNGEIVVSSGPIDDWLGGGGGRSSFDPRSPAAATPTTTTTARRPGPRRPPPRPTDPHRYQHTHIT